MDPENGTKNFDRLAPSWVFQTLQFFQGVTPTTWQAYFMPSTAVLP